MIRIIKIIIRILLIMIKINVIIIAIIIIIIIFITVNITTIRLKDMTNVNNPSVTNCSCSKIYEISE